MSIYNLKMLAPNKYQMAKFDEEFNVQAVYNLLPASKGQGYTCDCPANNRTVITKLCRHRRMLPLMLGAVNTDRFYEPETGSWCEPLGDLLRPTADLAGRDELTAEDITAMPDGLEKDFHEAMQSEGEALRNEPEELYGSMSPERKELLQVGQEMNVRQAAKIEAALAAAPTIRRR